MLLQRTAQEILFHVSPLLASAGVPHGFSTRIGGVSPVPFNSLNLGISRDSQLKDSVSNVEENYRRFLSAIGCPARNRAWVSQVHGRDVCAIHRGGAFESGCRADALVTNDPSRVVSVKYADCVPILLASRDGKVVAAVHAGWRGTVAGIIPAAIEQLRRLTAQPLVAAIGPCICAEHFEVGREVIESFTQVFGDDPALFYCQGEKGRVDLRACVRRQLVDSEVNDVDISADCTLENREHYFSHRRDGATTGRMAAAIAPRNP